MEQTISMKYLSHNFRMIESYLAKGNEFLSSEEIERYAKIIDLISELLNIEKRNMESILDDSAEAKEIRDTRYSVKRIQKLDMINLITNL